MQTQSRRTRWPALVVAALMGATSVAAFSPPLIPAYAAAVQPGGYADLVARVAPGVVYIEVTKAAATAAISSADLPPVSRPDSSPRTSAIRGSRATLRSKRVWEPDSSSRLSATS